MLKITLYVFVVITLSSSRVSHVFLSIRCLIDQMYTFFLAPLSSVFYNEATGPHDNLAFRGRQPNF